MTLESLSDDAIMVFDGLPVGPFAGKDAIAEAYRQSPPDDAIDVIEIHQTDPGSALVAYAWRSDPAKTAGQMRLSWGPDGLLRALEIRLP